MNWLKINKLRLNGVPPFRTSIRNTRYGPAHVHKATFRNGIKVIAADPDGGEISACTIMFQVGSRNEFDDFIGVTHYIRAGSATSGEAHSGYIRARYLQQQGGYLTIATDRQTIAYTLRCPQPVFKDFKTFFVDAAARCQYPDYELDEVRKRVRDDLDRIPPQQHVMDLIQTACFRGPLSNSIYCPEGRINSIKSENINDFIGLFYNTAVCTVGASAVHYGEVMKIAAQINCNRTERPVPKCVMPISCPRGGFEFHDTGPGTTYIAVAVPGTGTCDFQCLVKHAILAAACGLGNVNEGTHISDRSPQPPIGLLSGEDIFTDFRAFNISYLDTGCFGVLVRTHSKSARCAGFKAAQFLSNICALSADQIQIGKKRLKLGVMLNDDSAVRSSESLALQVTNNVTYNNAFELGCIIDTVPAEEVLKLANCIAGKRNGGQMAYAVVGDVEAAPHDGELR